MGEKLIKLQHINFGIKKCLRNARFLNEISKTIFEHGKKIGDFRTHTFPENYSVVLYYYAIEEVGKAIKLKELKQIGVNKKIVSCDWFYDHKSKIEAVQNKFPDLKIPVYHFKKISDRLNSWAHSGFFPIEAKERASWWLVDHNDQENTWEPPLELLRDDFETKPKKLDEIIQQLLDEIK